MKRLFACLGVALLLVGGCNSYVVRNYDISVQNHCSGPITIWLTKDGPPFEPGWLAPEDIALESPKAPDHVVGGVVVPAGKIADTGIIKGRFEPQTRGVLRVYGGKLSFAELLASSSSSKNRMDVDLHRGRNRFVVTGTPNAVNVREVDDADATFDSAVPATTRPANHP